MVTRRRVAGVALAVVAVPPLARIGVLRMEDNPLPPVADPQLVFEGGWILDAGDLEAGARS